MWACEWRWWLVGEAEFGAGGGWGPGLFVGGEFAAELDGVAGCKNVDDAIVDGGSVFGDFPGEDPGVAVDFEGAGVSGGSVLRDDVAGVEIFVGMVGEDEQACEVPSRNWLQA